MRRGVVAGIVLGALLVSACGYRVVRYRDALGGARSVAIEGLRNETPEPGLDALVTDALSREFLRRGALRLADDPGAADLRVGGVVSDLTTRSLSVSSIQRAVEYEVSVEIDLQVRRRDGAEVPMDRRGLTETEIYLASPDIEATRKNRREALRRLASLLAGRVHDALFERGVP